MTRVMLTSRSGHGAPVKRIREDHLSRAQNVGEGKVAAPSATYRRTTSSTTINEESIDTRKDVSLVFFFGFFILVPRSIFLNMIL